MSLSQTLAEAEEDWHILEVCKRQGFSYFVYLDLSSRWNVFNENVKSIFAWHLMSIFMCITVYFSYFFISFFTVFVSNQFCASLFNGRHALKSGGLKALHITVLSNLCLISHRLQHPNGTMKFLVLALAVALLFTAGGSVTDSPLNKHNLCCCATQTSANSAL